MNNWIKQSGQFLRYVLSGGATTAVNYGVFLTLTTISIHYLAANAIAWIVAVLFAYYVNKHVVFRTKGSRRDEFLQFISLRLTTLLLESMLLFAAIAWIQMPELIAKVTVSIVTVTLNYAACKHSVFKERRNQYELQKQN